MLKVSNLRGFNRVPQPANMLSVFNQSLPTLSGGWQGFTVRQFIQPSGFPLAPSLVQFVRFGVTAPPGGACGIGNLFVGIEAAATGLNAKMMRQMTFQNGSSTTYNLAAGTTVLTDICEFLWDKTFPLVVSCFIVGATTGNLAVATGLGATSPSTYFYIQGDQSGILVPTGSWTQSTGAANQLALTSRIDMGIGP